MGWGGGGGGLRNLMLSSNLLKSKIPMLRVGWGGVGSRNLMLSSNLLKSKIPMLRVGGGFFFAEFDAEFKFAKIQNSYVEGGGGGGLQNLMLSSNLLKSKIPMLRVGWGGGGFTEFDAEFKFAKIQNSYVEGGGGGGFVEFDAEFKFAKIQNSYFHEPPPPCGERWILVEASFDLGGQCLVLYVKN